MQKVMSLVLLTSIVVTLTKNINALKLYLIKKSLNRFSIMKILI